LKFITINLKWSAAIFLLLVAIAQFYWLYESRGIAIPVALLDSFGGYLLLYGLFFFMMNYSPDYYLPAYIRYVLIGLQSIAISFLWVSFCRYTLLAIFSDEANYRAIWAETIYIRGFAGWILLCDFSLVNYLWNKLNQAKEAIQKERQSEKLRDEAELFKLRQQLHPHFLFNSLNSINALIGKEPQNARIMLQQLSEYLRNTLKKEDKDLIFFQEELEDLRLYLSIEKVRFGHRLTIEEHIQENCGAMKIPPFLLQPLVENAVKYGLYGTIGAVEIHIKAFLEADFLSFIITNPYDPEAVTPKGTGFGLESIKRRLYLLFARNDLLTIKPNWEVRKDNPYFLAQIKIPVNPA
jgi:sensor histidine kinase YesM